jgi:dUTP pyrophosphatase
MLKFLRLSPDAILPSRSTPRSSGLDLCAVLPPGQGRLTLPPGERARVGTGWAVELPVGTEGQIRPRSGLAFKKGLTVLNAPGTIDEDYRGELMVLLINHGDCNVCITPGMKIAQLVVGSVRTIDIPVEVQDEPALTERGARGFGSTEETALTQLPARAYAEFLTERSVRTFSQLYSKLTRNGHPARRAWLEAALEYLVNVGLLRRQYRVMSTFDEDVGLGTFNSREDVPATIMDLNGEEEVEIKVIDADLKIQYCRAPS